MRISYARIIEDHVNIQVLLFEWQPYYLKLIKLRLTMKASSLLFLFFLIFVSSSFTTISEFKYLIKGIDHDLRGGLKLSELNELTVLSTNRDIKVQAFSITLARGNRAVQISNVKGHKFNLRKFVGIARSGDRIVVKIEKVNYSEFDQNKLPAWVFSIN